MKMIKQLAKISSLVITVILLNACVAAAVTGVVAASGATSAYVMGTLRAEVKNASPMQITEATKRAFHTLAIKVQEIEATNVDAVIIGYTASEKKITIKVKRTTDKLSELTIHIGYFGDEALSELIYKEIIKELSQTEKTDVQTFAVPSTSAPVGETESIYGTTTTATSHSVHTTTSESTSVPMMQHELASTPPTQESTAISVQEHAPIQQPVPQASSEPIPTPVPILEAEPVNNDPYTPIVPKQVAPPESYSDDAAPIPVKN